MKNHFPTKQRLLLAENLRFAKKFFPNRTPVVVEQLRAITLSFSFSLKFGDLLLLSSGWHITHAGLIRLAKRCHCSGMHSQPVRQLSDPSASRYAFRATVYKSSSCRGFVGYGDADPSNVSPLVRGAEMRVAETRAVNRALRKAYGIGLCSVEELGWEPKPYGPSNPQRPTASAINDGHQNGHTRLRDRLSL